MARTKPASKRIVDPETGNLTLEWGVYLEGLEKKIASLEGAILGGSVASFEGRTGIVTGQAGDYTATEVTYSPAGNIAATTVQVAIQELDTEKLATSAYTAADVLAKLLTVDGAASGVDADMVDGQHASAFAAASHGHAIADVTGLQTALDAKALGATTLTAGAGLTGGGDLTANRSFAIGAGTGIAVNADDVALSHLGLQTLTDPGADRIGFWDDSASSFAWLEVGTNLSITGTVLNAAAAATGGITVSTAQATTSGTAFDFTGIPADVNRITLILSGVDLSGTDSFLVQIGDSGGIETTGYVSASFNRSGSGNSTAGFIIFRNNESADPMSGSMVLTRITGNVWVASHALGEVALALGCAGGGNKTLSDTLDRVRLTRSGTNTFNAGQVNIFYE